MTADSARAGALASIRRWVILFVIGLVVSGLTIAGPVRGIPAYWQIIDCSFG